MHTEEKELLSLYTIYDHPKDYPNHFVVRRFIYYKNTSKFVPTTHIKLYTDLTEARKLLIDAGLICLSRDPKDDPAIVETWL